MATTTLKKQGFTVKRSTNGSNRPTKQQLDDEQKQRLCDRLNAYCDQWMRNERGRRDRDRLGISMFRGQTKHAGFNEQRILINSCSPLALFERVVAEVLRGTPEPEIESIDRNGEEAAIIAQGALQTNWRNDRMREKMDNAYRLSGFTRAVACYSYWKEEALGGVGDVAHRFIQADRLIVDERFAAVQDMQFVGFQEPTSRAKLITLFPDKVREIEDAAERGENLSSGATDNPLAYGSSPATARRGGSDRQVSTSASNVPPYSPVTSTNYKQVKDPLAEVVDVCYMWVDDPSPMRVFEPMTDPVTGEHQYQAELDDSGELQLEEKGYEVIETSLGPQYVPRMHPKLTLVMEEKIVRKYKYRRHVAYIPGDDVVLWDVAWDGPIPLTILRDRAPAEGFYAEGSALRLSSLGAARSMVWSIIVERLRKSMAGTFLTTPGSNFKRSQMINEIGMVFSINSLDAIKDFPNNPVEPAYFNLVDKLEQEMELLIGVTPAMRGQAAGRADSPQTYQQLADQSGGPILDRAKLVDQFVQDQAAVDLWFMQSFYTHRHVVEIETDFGYSDWQEASALAMDATFSVRVETGSTLTRSAQSERADAEANAAAGIYALPMFAKVARVKHWKQAMRQMEFIRNQGPNYSWLIGQAGAGPVQQAQSARANIQRSHHRIGG